MARESRATWARRVRRWRRSGLAAERFARQEGVNPRTLAFWRWKLGLGGRGWRTRAPATPTTASPMDFVELVPTRPAPPADESGASVELVLPAGYRVRLEGGCHRGTLTALLDVLEARR